ncbi:MAG: hypothetical protein WCF79_10330 [Rhodomicrobium sp.]
MRAGTFTLMLALGIMTAPALAEEESLPDQIVGRPSDDPMIRARDDAYAVSFARRSR